MNEILIIIKKGSKLSMEVAKVTFPEGNTGYDVNQLEYCCPELEKDLINDGGAVILIDEGLCLRSNIAGPHRLLRYCYNCGAGISQPDANVAVEKPIEDIKPPVTDPIV